MSITIQLDVQGFMAEPNYFETWQEAKEYLIKGCWTLQPGSVWVDETELTLEFDEFYEVYAPEVDQITALEADYV